MQTLPSAQVTLNRDADGVFTLYCSGDWRHGGLQDIEKTLVILSRQCSDAGRVVWQLADIAAIDSAGMMLLVHCFDSLQARQCRQSQLGVSANFQQLEQLVREHSVAPPPPEQGRLAFRLLRPFTLLGEKSVNLVADVLAFLAFLGESFIVFFRAFLHPLSIRYDAIIKNIEETGVRALPVVALTSVLIGVVVTYQGAVQLEKFGANIFIVDMIGIAMTRELAPLITAIVVAGRTGSSFTAQLGVMKITEEIDAMRTMGFDPHHYLVLPRILALIIALPLLVVFADVLGIAAGMMISEIHLDVSYSEFIHRLQSVLEMKQVIIGLIKAPVFAWLIAVTGCFRGFQVAKNTESIGRFTTLSVVNAIFLVIACDAVFSVILTEMGL